MDNQIVATCSLLFLTIFSLYFLKRIYKHKGLNFPPGTNPWPVIGNLNLIGPLPHRSIHHLSQKYSPFMQLKLGSYTVVVGSSVAAAKVFLKTMDLTFASRPKTTASTLTAYDSSDITWSPYGPHWKQARRTCSTKLFSARRLTSYEHVRAEEMRSLLKVIHSCSGREFVVKHCMSTMCFNMICRMVMGRRYFDGGENAGDTREEFKKRLEELIIYAQWSSQCWGFYPLHFLDLQGYVKRMKAVSKIFDGFLEHEARRRAAAPAADHVSRDTVDALLELAEDPTLEVKIDRQEIKSITQNLLAGGNESSAMTAEWALSEMLKKPEIFEKATKELDSIIGKDRWVKEDDIPNLPYLQAIVKETMRLHPVAPMLVPRLAREDCKVDGYDIKKGTQVLVNIWSIQRDPLIWENPNEFNPDRFIGKDIDVKGKDFELLPFGSGRRMCLGYLLGLKVVQSSLANLLQGYNWKLSGKMKPEELDMEEIFGLSTPKKFPLVVVAEPSLPLILNSSL